MSVLAKSESTSLMQQFGEVVVGWVDLTTIDIVEVVLVEKEVEPPIALLLKLRKLPRFLD